MSSIRRQIALYLLAGINISDAIEVIDILGAPQEHWGNYHDFKCDSIFPLDAIRVNDNVCDCADGSDEPGTSACSDIPGTTFYCYNEGILPMSIPSAYVNDDICDCCDGTDEASTNRCDNICSLQIQVQREQALKTLEQVTIGYEAYQTRLLWAKRNGEARTEKLKLLANKVGRLNTLTVQLKLFQSHEENIEKQAQKMDRKKMKMMSTRKEKEQVCTDAKDEECSVPTAEHQSDIGSILQSPVDTRVNASLEGAELMLSEFQMILSDGSKLALPDYMKQAFIDIEREQQKNQVKMKTEGFLNPILQNGKKGILLGLTYVLQIAGIAVLPLRLLKDAMQWCSRKISESYGMWFELDDDELGEEIGTLDSHKYLDCTFLQGISLPQHWILEFRRFGGGVPWRWMRYFQWAVETCWDGPYDFLFPVYDTSIIRNEAESLRFLALEIKAEMSRFETVKDKLTAKFYRNYGKENEFLFLNGKCVNYDYDNYNYRICPFHNITQDQVLIGSWANWGTARVNNRKDLEKPYHSMFYDNGEQCWNGPKRSASVHLSCGHPERITEVSEPSKCEYRFHLVTPSACSPRLVQEAQDQLDHLALKP